MINKQRLYIIGAGGIVLLFLLYKFAFSNTLVLYFENKDLSQKIDKAEFADKDIDALNNKIKNLNDKLSKYTVDSIRNKETIFDVITGFCSKNGIRVREMPSEGVDDHGDYIIETNKIVSEGDFISLTKLVNFIECQSLIGRVSSVKYYSYHDFQKQKDILLLNIYVQNIVVK
jgi:hypothetical protein